MTLPITGAASSDDSAHHRRGVQARSSRALMTLPISACAGSVPRTERLARATVWNVWNGSWNGCVERLLHTPPCARS
eukprot:CAMPEP_0115857302 /NCGR_PEP_ID=MMETSP0287-20121206/15504_1 /TAXON_ID=412157 /ORGANISM="Chrysochromulina rotalis, Strain UIO044" /LENGTH=76 /DNA_ID=CAMNT_0003311515 /DNA_START=377 /DNA_END=604 /DNA_ORIENTATION=+